MHSTTFHRQGFITLIFSKHLKDNLAQKRYIFGLKLTAHNVGHKSAPRSLILPFSAIYSIFDWFHRYLSAQQQLANIWEILQIFCCLTMFGFFQLFCHYLVGFQPYFANFLLVLPILGCFQSLGIFSRPCLNVISCIWPIHGKFYQSLGCSQSYLLNIWLIVAIVGFIDIWLISKFKIQNLVYNWLVSLIFG